MRVAIPTGFFNLVSNYFCSDGIPSGSNLLLFSGNIPFLGSESILCHNLVCCGVLRFTVPGFTRVGWTSNLHRSIFLEDTFRGKMSTEYLTIEHLENVDALFSYLLLRLKWSSVLNADWFPREAIFDGEFYSLLRAACAWGYVLAEAKAQVHLRLTEDAVDLIL
jgi:hypothetical protein